MEYTKDSFSEWVKSGKSKLETSIFVDAWTRVSANRKEEIARVAQAGEPRNSLEPLTRDELVGFDYLAKEAAMVIAAGGVLVNTKED